MYNNCQYILFIVKYDNIEWGYNGAKIREVKAMKESEYIKNFYDRYDEDSRLRTKYGLVEFITTMTYIKRYLKPNDKIIDIGAGTGRYSHALAELGYSIDAVELVDSNIDIFKKNMTEEMKISITQGNAKDLSGFKDNTYDVTLLFGPMYHLFNTEDKEKVLSEAIRVTKENGIVFIAYCISDATILSDGFIGGYLKEFIEQEWVDTDTFKTESKPKDLFELVRKEDIDIITSRFNVERLHYVATDGFTNFMRETIEKMDEETFDIYMRYHLSICERTDMVGLTHHSLDVLKKL